MPGTATRLSAIVGFSIATLAACAPDPQDGAAQTADETTLSEAITVVSPPRLTAPLSTAISTSQRPLFRWTSSGAGRVTLEICRDRGCGHPIASVETNRSFGRPERALPAGVVYWHVSEGHGRRRTASATWELTIPARDSGRVGSWGAIPDFNGDGFGDLAVGVKGATSQVRVFPGGRSGIATTPAQTLTGGAGFGDELGSAGDLDGDGFGDLAVWTSGPPQTVTVYHGGPAGLGAPVTFPAPAADQFSQMRVVSAGDVDGDGYGDLLVGGGANAALHLGGPRGIHTTPAELLTSVPAGSAAVPDARWPIGGGDFNGDRRPDAVIAGINGAQLYEGDGRRLVAQPDFPLPLPVFGALAGDFNGDGFNDLNTQGAIDTGGPTGLGFFQAIAGAYFYQGVGDTNGDGFSDDLAMISSLFGVPEAERIYFGGTTPCASTACPTFVPLLVPGHLNNGNGLAAVLPGGLGDVNGDGFGDLAYGSPGAGAVYLFLGGPAGPPQTPSLTITSEPGFGFSLARL
jgi:hypothetical protein